MIDPAGRSGLILAQVLAGATPAESELKLHVLRTPKLHGALLDEEVVDAILSDLALPLSRRTAIRVLVEAGLAYDSDGTPRIANELSRDLSEGDVTPTLAELADWVERLAAQPAAEVVDAHAIAHVIGRSAAWAATITTEAKNRGLSGLPVFWIPTSGGYRPETADIGSIATIDGLLMLLNGIRIAPDTAAALTPAVRSLCSDLVGMQRTTEDWYDGVQVTPMWDDDFVGSLVPEYADRGPCPTLDSTACLVTGLSAALASSVADELPAAVAEAVRRAVACIVRWQSPDGSWAVHRTEAGAWTAPPRTLSTVYAVEAMAAASAVLDVSLDDAPQRALGFLQSQVRSDGPGVNWTMDFVQRPGKRDLGATALVLPALASLGTLCDEDLGRLVEGAADHLRASWVPSGDALVISFRVPTWGGLADDRFEWELPLDPIVVTALLRDERASARLDRIDRRNVAAAVSTFVAQCDERGFWVDLLKAEEGNIQGMTGNSDFFQTALIDYLRDARRVLEGLV